MKPVNALLDGCRSFVRGYVERSARVLNRISGGKLTPNTVTIIGLVAHIPIAILIGSGHFLLAAAALAFFGLFDALDGALARLQKKAGSAGMLLDASTDRMKEVLLYCGVAYALIASDQAKFAVWAVAACGASLCVSYVKAKGETAVKDSHFTPNEINRLFQDGLLRFEIRMTLLIIGLLGNWLAAMVVIIAVFSSYTAIARLVSISSSLQEKHQQD